jgi:hypothetical protein
MGAGVVLLIAGARVYASGKMRGDWQLDCLHPEVLTLAA